MLKALKKVLADYQSKQAQAKRKANNRKQIKLILKGLEERGY
mgnify:FL=1|jgi:hypothetical protein|nr:MAG TPA: hypothetical protein [Caudoviricetes sp.]